MPVYLDGASSKFFLDGDDCDIELISCSSLNEQLSSTAKGYVAYQVEAKYKFIWEQTKSLRVISPLSWNNVISEVGKLADVTVTKATVKLLSDVVLVEDFTSNDNRLTIDGNGNTITGTIKIGASPSVIKNAVLGDGATLDCSANVNCGFSNVSVADNTGINIILPASANVQSYSLPVTLVANAYALISVGERKYIAKNGSITATESVAQVGQTKYATLQEAIDAANGATVHLLRDVELSGSASVVAGKSVTLNLAGRAITVAGADYALINNGSLTIIDEALVVVTAAENVVSEDEEVFYITGIASSVARSVATGSVAGVKNNGSFTLESGTLVPAANDVPALENTSTGTVAIAGGNVQGKLQSVEPEKITITGGTFSADSNVSDYLDSNQGVDENGAVIAYVAQLGLTKYQTLNEAFAAAKDKEVVTILDANVDCSNVPAYVTKGLYPISNGDGTYVVRTMPDATVEKLPAFTLDPSRDEYYIWDGSTTSRGTAGDVERPLDVVMNFIANDDGKAEANATGFADWKCDFYLTFTGMTGDSIVADKCYLAGNYGGYAWVVIPADEVKVDNGAEIPVVAIFDDNITYRQICQDVKKFTAAIHMDEAVLNANPNLTVTLELKMKNPIEGTNQELVVGSYTYTVEDLKGSSHPDVKVADEVSVTDTFKKSVGSALADAYQQAEGNLEVEIKAVALDAESITTAATIDVTPKADYAIPDEGLEMTFPARYVADGDKAFVVHKHKGDLYVYAAEVEYGFVTYKNTLGFSEFTVGDESALSLAIANADDGAKIILQDDVVLTSKIKVNKNITLDLNGKTINAMGTYVFWFEGGSLVVQDSSNEKTGKIDGSKTVTNAFLLMGNESLTIEGGTIHAYNNVIYANGSGATVTINGGELKSYIATGNIFYLVGANDTIVVNEGTFIGNVNPYASGLSIKGGQFTADVNTWCVEGFEAVDNKNGTWTVLPYIAMVGEDKFTSLADAIAAAAEAGVKLVTLLGDSKESVTLPDDIQIYANCFTVGSVVDSNGYIVEKVDGAYQVGVNPSVPAIRSIVVAEGTVELRIVERAGFISPKVMVSTDLKTWVAATESSRTGGGVGKETVITVEKPDGASAFFKVVFE